jgi:glycerophosphoryl diester phosphodiesterase
MNKPMVCFWFSLIYFIFFAGEGFAKCPVRMGSEFPPENFLVVAHRGAASQFPENTLRAFQQALDDGANALQVDISFTQDKQIILWHDWNPNNPIALIRQEGKEPVVKFKPFTPQKNSQWRKKTSNLPLNEFRKRYGYIEKESNVKSKISIPGLQEFMV